MDLASVLNCDIEPESAFLKSKFCSILIVSPEEPFMSTGISLLFGRGTTASFLLPSPIRPIVGALTIPPSAKALIPPLNIAPFAAAPPNSEPMRLIQPPPPSPPPAADIACITCISCNRVPTVASVP